MNDSHFPVRSVDNFDPEDSDDLFGVARQLIDGRHFGVLTTVDADGAPHARWMATLSFDAFPRLLTLTGGSSSKLRHIRENPRVQWMFSNEDLTLVLNLSGRARIFTDTRSIKLAWKEVKDKSRAYFLNHFAGKPAIAVIETTVERIEYLSAENGLRFSRVIGAAAAAKNPPASTTPRKEQLSQT